MKNRDFYYVGLVWNVDERLLTCTRGPFLNRITNLERKPRQQAGAGCRWALQTNFSIRGEHKTHPDYRTSSNSLRSSRYSRNPSLYCGSEITIGRDQLVIAFSH